MFGNGGKFVSSMCGDVYIFRTNENTSFKVGYTSNY
jgi:hypothetical protein